MGSGPPRAARVGALVPLLVLLGVGLRTWAYLANPSLWLDEILLSRNILRLPLRELLTRPLHLDQVAPPGFLLIEKLAVGALGANELALRLFPFLCGIAGLFLFRRLAERTLEGAAVPLAVALCAIAIPFIRYGTEVKQYGTDAAAAILLLVLALDLLGREPSSGRLVLAGLAGLAIASVSQASVLVMAGIGLAVLVLWLLRRDGVSARVLLVTMPLWALAAAGATVLGMRSMSPSTREFMHDFWRQGMMPWPPGWPGGIEWLWRQLQSVFDEPTLLRYPCPPLYLALSLVGVVALWRRRREVVLLLLGPFVMALGAAAAQQYPFRGRLMLYLVPGLLLTVAAGAEWIRQRLERLHPAAGWTAIAVLVALPIVALAKSPPPYEIEHHRAIITYLERHRRPGDAVHVFPLSRIGMLYYGPRYGLEAGEWTTARCDRFDTRAYVRDLDQYRGTARLWVVSTDGRAYRTATAAVHRYLRTIGVRRDSLVRPSLTFRTVSLVLYDLSDTARLRAASADTFPVQPMPSDPRPGCRPWASPSPRDTFP